MRDRHGATQLDVVPLVHHPHATTTKLTENHVTPDAPGWIIDNGSNLGRDLVA